MDKEYQGRIERAIKKLLPGERQSVAALIYTKQIVEDAANKTMGFEPDKGYRPMTAAERIREFDSFTIEQKNAIIDKKGMAWFLSYAEEIDNLKLALRQGGGNV